MENKSNKGIIIVLVVLLLISLGVGGYFGYKYFTNKPSREQQENNLKYKLKLCINKDEYIEGWNDYYSVDDDISNKSFCGDEKLEIAVESENAKYIDSNKNFVLLLDNNVIKIYDVKNKKLNSYNNIETNYKDYYLIAYGDKLYGISYGNTDGIFWNELCEGNDVAKYYDINTQSYKYEDYFVRSAIGGDKLELISVIDCDNKTVNVIDYNSGNFIIKGIQGIRSSFSEKSGFLIESYGPDTGPYCTHVYYTNSGKEITKDASSYYSIINQNTLYYINNDSLSKYDNNGNLKEKKQFDNSELLAIFDDYIVSKKNNEIYMINMDTYEELFVTKLNAGDEFVDYESGSFDSKDNKLEKGTYCISIYNNNNNESKYVIFNTKTKQIEKEN